MRGADGRSAGGFDWCGARLHTLLERRTEGAKAGFPTRVPFRPYHLPCHRSCLTPSPPTSLVAKTSTLKRLGTGATVRPQFDRNFNFKIDILRSRISTHRRRSQVQRANCPLRHSYACHTAITSGIWSDATEPAEYSANQSLVPFDTPTIQLTVILAVEPVAPCGSPKLRVVRYLKKPMLWTIAKIPPIPTFSAWCTW